MGCPSHLSPNPHFTFPCSSPCIYLCYHALGKHKTLLHLLCLLCNVALQRHRCIVMFQGEVYRIYSMIAPSSESYASYPCWPSTSREGFVYCVGGQVRGRLLAYSCAHLLKWAFRESSLFSMTYFKEPKKRREKSSLWAKRLSVGDQCQYVGPKAIMG